MIRVIIVGAAGRMGRHLVTAVLESGDMKLAGALEHQACPLVGKDAGTVAGHEPCGIEIVSDIGGLGDADAAIDFSTGPVADNAEYLAGRGCSIVIGTTALKDATGRKGKGLFLPLRQALTGMDHGPDMGELLPLIGEEQARARLLQAAA